MKFLDIFLKTDNTHEMRVKVDGESLPLNTITKMELWIPELGVLIEDSDSAAYPFKWDTGEVGMFEISLGMNTDIIGKFFLDGGTVDTTTGETTISNISSISSLKKGMVVLGASFSNDTKILSIDEENLTAVLSRPSIDTIVGDAIEVFEDLDVSQYLGKLYIYYGSDKYHWNDFLINVRF